MLKRNCTRVLVIFFAIVATGCTASGSTSSGPISMDGRIKNIDELAARLSYRYNDGFKKVGKVQAMSKHHQHYGDFALTLFNVRATMGDLPDMIETFRNYCWYLGGIQRVAGRSSEISKSFALGCEPKELREIGKYRSRKDSRYYLYFVNVVLTPKFKEEKTAENADAYKAESYINNREKANRQNAHLDMPGAHTPLSRLRNGYYTDEHATHYRHSIGYYSHHQHNNGYSTIHPHEHNYYQDRSDIKNPSYTRYSNKNPYNNVARPVKPVSTGVYCVNFLTSENQTYNTALTKLPNYKKYRKEFISILNKTKAYC